jgi:hypothetical protein
VKLDALIPIVGLILLLLKPQIDIPFINPKPSPSPAPIPGPGPVVPINGAITALIATHEDGQQLAAFFEAMANVVEKDALVIKTNDDFYKGYKNAGALMFQASPGVVQNNAAIAAAVDQQLQAAVPLAIAPWTPDKKAAMVAALRNVAAQAAAK